MSSKTDRHPNQYVPSMGARFSTAVFNSAARLALKIFERRTKNAVRTNVDTLLKIVELNKGTRFGQKHRLDEIKIVGDPIPRYKNRVRLTRFSDYSEYIDRISEGQSNILTRDSVDIFAGSSGTTRTPKRLPSTRRARRKFMFFTPLVQHGVLAKNIVMAGPTQRGINLMSLHTPVAKKNVAQPVTSANNAAMRGLRSRIRTLWISPVAVFGIEHQPTAYYLHALFGLVDRDAAYLSGVFAPHLTAFFSVIENNRSQLLHDIETGAIASHLMLSRNERQSICSRFKPDPDRARILKREFEKGFRNIVPRIWPKMRYIATVTTGSFSIYLPRLRLLAGEQMPIYSPCHAATEAMIGINLSPKRDDYVLTLGSAFFEFIPLTHSDEDQPDTVSVETLQVGQEYEVVLTNFAGLYRYRLEDVIRIMGFHGQAPIFKFLYRKGAILNLVGEKITEYHTAKALTASIDEWLGPNGYLHDYTVAGEIRDGLSYYAFYAELDAEFRPNGRDPSNVATILDRELCRANFYYWSNGRNAERLGPVKFHLVEPGTFDSLTRLQDRRTDGAVSNQIKTPRVISDPEQLALLEKAVFFSASGADKTHWGTHPVP